MTLLLLGQDQRGNSMGLLFKGNHYTGHCYEFWDVKVLSFRALIIFVELGTLAPKRRVMGTAVYQNHLHMLLQFVEIIAVLIKLI